MAFSEDPNLGPLNSSITFGCLAGIFSILITNLLELYIDEIWPKDKLCSIKAFSKHFLK